MIIRKAKKNDEEFYTEAIYALAVYEWECYSKFNPKCVFNDNIKNEIKDLFHSKDSIVLIAEKDGQNIWILAWIIEWASDRYYCNNVFNIHYIFIVEKYRWNGYWTELMKELKKEAKKKNIDRITLWVLSDNISSIKFYEHLWYHEYVRQYALDI